MIFILGLLLMGFCLYPPMEGRVFYQALWGLSFLSLVYSYEFGKKLHWSLGLNLLIILLSGLYTFFFQVNYPIPIPPEMLARGSQETVYAMLTLLLFSTLLMTQDKKFFEKVLKLLFCVAVLDSLVMIWGRFYLHEIPPYGMLSNGTADACFIVCFLPYAIMKTMEPYRWMAMLVMLFSIFLSHSNTACASVGVGIAFILLQRMSLKNWVMIMFPVTAIFLLLARFAIGDHFLLDSGRRFVWEGSFQFYKQFANTWIGIGTGTFTSWGVGWQYAHYINDKQKTLWPWLHNEYLEILFENGIIGLFASLTALGYLLKKSFNSYIFPIVCVYSFTGLTEMPLRLWVTQLLGVALLGVIYSTTSRDIIHTEST